MSPVILKSTQPILYDTGYDEWPYAFAGSCYPVRWNDKLYIVSAHHCYLNHEVKPEKTLYSIPGSAPRQFYGFSYKLTAEAPGLKDKYMDQVILVVSKDLHEQRTLDLVDAIDLSTDKNTISLSEPSVSDVWLRGYLSENPSHEIDFESQKVKPQAYTTNGIVSLRVSNYAFCYLLKVKTPAPPGLSPMGMSGSPVYAATQDHKFGLAGTIIEYNPYTKEYLVIDSSVLRELLRRENA